MEPIAIIGMGCRFPGPEGKPIRTPEAFWELLRSGQDILHEIPAERWSIDDYYASDPNTPSKMYVRKGYFLDDVDQFDPTFFNLAPREAASLDPQQRLVLEVGWETLEHANIVPSTLKGSQTGIFVSTFWDDYSSQRLYANDPTAIDRYSILSNQRSMVSGRLAHFLGVRGPNVLIDTACSASLTAVHLACQSLRNRECTMALAGGSYLMLTPELTIGLCQMRALAADGMSKTFDRQADGFGQGEGCGMVLLKRLCDAEADGDTILSIIRGSAINHDGESRTVTTPNGLAQEELLNTALEQSRVEPHHIQYVETHGTGTELGDPIEVLAIAEVYGQKRTDSLAIGSVKTNIGHLNAAAGIAGLFKVVLAMQHGEIPPTLHVNQLNPRIPWQKLAMTVPTEVTPWHTDNGAARLAGVSSFGLSGSNAHVIVEEAPLVQTRQQTDWTERPNHLLLLSAKTIEALQAQVQAYRAYLQEHPKEIWADVCHTAATGREQFAHRLALVASSTEDAHQTLRILEQDFTQATYYHNTRRRPPKVAFLFTGQGSQYVGMGQELYATEPTFRNIIDRCDVIFQEVLGRSLIELLYPESEPRHNDLMESPPCLTGAIFAIECALVELWRSWGITPDIVLGHSLGDYAAAYVAGVFSLEDGLRLVTKRGQLMETALGSMISVLASEADILPFIADFEDVTVGVINGPTSIVLSGGDDSIVKVTERLQVAGFKTRPLNTPVANHSPLLDPVLGEFEQTVGTVTLNPPKCKVISSMTGQLVTDELTDPVHWRQHLRNTVHFGDGVATLHEQDVEIFIEIGPRATLLGIAHEIDETSSSDTNLVNSKSQIVNPTMLPSLRKNKSDWQQMLISLGMLYVHGVEIDWMGFEQNRQRQKMVLPTYPFQRKRYWVDLPKQRKKRNSLRPLIDKMSRLPLHGELLFETEVSTDTLPFLNDHLVHDTVVSPGACQLSMVLSVGELIWGKRIRSGQCYELSDVILPQALALDKDQRRMVQIVVTPVTENRQETHTKFQILSFEDDPDFGMAHSVIEGDEDATMTHAIGRVDVATMSIDKVPQTAGGTLREIQARCTEPYEERSVLDVGFLFLGPSFRWIDEVWHPVEQDATASVEVLTKLRCPDVVDTLKGYMLHPGLLDACFQTAVLVNAPPSVQGEQENEDVLLPFALNTLQLYTPSGHNPNDRIWWCHAEQVTSLMWNLHLFDEQGQLVATIDQFEMRKASPAAIQTTRLHTEWLQTIEWEERVLPETIAEIPDCWVLAGRLGGIGESLAALLQTEDVLLYRLTETGSQTEIQKKIAEIALHHQNIAVVYFGTVQEPVEHMPIETLDLSTGLLHLTQALVESDLRIHLWIITKGCQMSRPGPIETTPIGGALWGFGRTLMQEHPQLHCTCVDIDSSVEMDDCMNSWTELLAQELVKSYGCTWQESEVAYQDQIRHVAQLKTWDESLELQKEANEAIESVVLRPDATYLVTGGLGALGLQTTQQLVEDGARQLVLTGRRGVTTKVQQKIIDELQQRGTLIHVVTADIAQQEDVQRVLDHCTAIAPLRGIIHAAGLIDDGILATQTHTRFEAVMKPKVNGTWHLHTLTQNLNLDFFVCFSSVTSLLGNPGQSNYAAANAFMDTLMQQRYANGLPGLSINWGGWSGIGLAAHLEEHMRRLGISMIPPQQGMKLFRYLLARQLLTDPGGARQGKMIAQIGVLPMKRTEKAPEQPTSSLDWQAYQSMSQEERQQSITNRLVGMIARTGGFTETQINPEQSLLTIGLDSLMAVELRHQVMQTFNLNIPISHLLGEETIGTLIKRIVEYVAESGDSLSTIHNDQIPSAQMPVPPMNGRHPNLLAREGNLYTEFEGEL